MIKYERADDVNYKVMEIIKRLGFDYINMDNVTCIRSRGSKSRGVLARCHTLSKIIQKALDLQAHYVIEVISEKFDRLPEEEKVRTLIHEVMHIPKSFGGGFKYHNHVNRHTVERMYETYLRNKSYY